MRREQEHMLNPCVLPRLQESLCTTFRRAEQSKCICNSARLILGDGGGIVRVLELEAGGPEPAKIRGARIGEEGLTWSEPAPHPSRPHLGIGSETERDHENHREAGQERPARLAPSSR